MNVKRMIAAVAIVAMLFTAFISVTALASDQAVYYEQSGDDAVENPLTGDIIFAAAVIVASSSILALYLVMRKRYISGR